MTPLSHRPSAITLEPRTLWLYYWLPAFAWLVLVALFSNQPFGAFNTGNWLRQLFDLLHIQMSEATFRVVHHFVRKGAHFFAYGILSWLLFRAFRKTDTEQKAWRWKWALLALGICLLTGSGDELHQSFTPGRTGNWKDVTLDMIGAVFFQLVMVFLAFRKPSVRH
ncbi:MAG: VanZ family protein [Acidobacteriales bacterium]|nr:VanZ family protein [Terriglobales bacterium]